MELADILSFLKDFPFWGWIILLLIYAFIFGDRKLWEYEVKFPMEPGVGRGEIELECHKKKGAQIEVSLELEPAYHHKSIEILKNGFSIYKIEPNLNTGKRLFVKRKTSLEQPKEGDEITVIIDDQSVFTGRLVLD